MRSGSIGMTLGKSVGAESLEKHGPRAINEVTKLCSFGRVRCLSDVLKDNHILQTRKVIAAEHRINSISLWRLFFRHVASKTERWTYGKTYAVAAGVEQVIKQVHVNKIGGKAYAEMV